MNFDQCFTEMQRYEKIADKIISIYQEEGAFGDQNKNRRIRFFFKGFSNFRAVDRIIIECTKSFNSEEQHSIVIPKSMLDNFNEQNVREHAKEKVENLKKLEKERLSTEEKQKEITLLRQLQAKYPEITP